MSAERAAEGRRRALPALRVLRGVDARATRARRERDVQQQRRPQLRVVRLRVAARVGVHLPPGRGAPPQVGGDAAAGVARLPDVSVRERLAPAVRAARAALRQELPAEAEPRADGRRLRRPPEGDQVLADAAAEGAGAGGAAAARPAAGAAAGGAAGAPAGRARRPARRPPLAGRPGRPAVLHDGEPERADAARAVPDEHRPSGRPDGAVVRQGVRLDHPAAEAGASGGVRPQGARPGVPYPAAAPDGHRRPAGVRDLRDLRRVREGPRVAARPLLLGASHRARRGRAPCRPPAAPMVRPLPAALLDVPGAVAAPHDGARSHVPGADGASTVAVLHRLLALHLHEDRDDAAPPGDVSWRDTGRRDDAPRLRGVRRGAGREPRVGAGALPARAPCAAAEHAGGGERPAAVGPRRPADARRRVALLTLRVAAEPLRRAGRARAQRARLRVPVLLPAHDERTRARGAQADGARRRRRRHRRCRQRTDVPGLSAAVRGKPRVRPARGAVALEAGHRRRDAGDDGGRRQGR